MVNLVRHTLLILNKPSVSVPGVRPVLITAELAARDMVNLGMRALLALLRDNLVISKRLLPFCKLVSRGVDSAICLCCKEGLLSIIILAEGWTSCNRGEALALHLALHCSLCRKRLRSKVRVRVILVALLLQNIAVSHIRNLRICREVERLLHTGRVENGLSLESIKTLSGNSLNNCIEELEGWIHILISCTRLKIKLF